MQKKLINYLIFILIILNFTSCGRTDEKPIITEKKIEEKKTEEVIIKTAVFIDDIVSGLRYENNGEVEFTNEKGEFNYTKGDIDFYIGNIKIGTISSIPDDNLVFIQDLLKLPRENTKDPKVLAIGTLLQSLDSNKSSNNIEIIKKDFDKFLYINKDIKDINVSKVLADNNFTSLPRYKVVNHLEDTNNKYAFNQTEKDFLKDLFNIEYLWSDMVIEHNSSKFTNPMDMINEFKYKELDKWSFSQTFSNYESQSVQKSDGFGCEYYEDVIVNVVRGSPCQTSGLLRGDIVFLINDKNITYESYMDAANNLGTESKFTVARPQNDLNNSYLPKEILITPNAYTYKVSQKDIFVDNQTNAKIGYFIYDQFTALSTDEIDKTFKYFKDNNISELVIDLRYNGGGELNTAAYLTSNIQNKYINSTMFKLKHNNYFSYYNEIVNFFKVSNSIDISRVIFLTSPNTASASELVINSLKPYMDVVLIGDKTHGKPVGMYGRNISNKFIYWLINFTLINANDEGYFYDGIDVDCQITENINFQRYNVDDTLFNEALYYIKNNSCSNKNSNILPSNYTKLN